MRSPRSRWIPMFCALLTCAIVTFVEPEPASAGSSVKSSAGTMKRGPSSVRRGAGTIRRGAGNRRGNDLGSRTRGHESTMTSSRRAGSSFSDDDDDDDDHDDEDRDDSRDSDDDEKRDRGRSGAKAEEDTEEEVPDFGKRTLGKACIYGVRGEVVYRPPGGSCRGDPGPAAIAPSRARHQNPAAASSSTRRRFEAPPRRSKPSVRRPATRSRCTYDSNGGLMHTPAGEFCPPRAANQKPKDRP